MRLTNKFNLPEPFVKAVATDDYERGDADYTTTELTKPVRIQAYTKKYWDEIEEDVSDRLWAFMGQTKHAVLERIAQENPDHYLVEHRFACQLGRYKISGKIDLFDFTDGTLYDWKEQSIWKFIVGDVKDWEEQGNINAYLMRANDLTVRQLVNVCFLRDWKKRMARTTRRKDYPKCALNVTPLPLWSAGQAQAFILKRVQLHEEGAADPPVCSFKERWQRFHEWAVMRKGRKSALSVLDSQDRAQAELDFYVKRSVPGQKFYLEERPTEPVRCLDFCPVQKFCDFGRQAAKDWENNAAEPKLE